MRHFYNSTEYSITYLKNCREAKHIRFQTDFFVCRKKICVLSLGSESVGRFCFYDNGEIFISENFGDILNESNLERFKKNVLKQIKIKKPDIILTDLHPLYNSTIFGEELSQKLKITHIKIQHHIAHIFCAVGDYMLNNNHSMLNTFYGIAADGTGFGFDKNIWGGEIFKITNHKSQITNKSKIAYSKIKIIRIGSAEEQTMIGGDLAVKEPARMLISILNKFLPKEKIYKNVTKYYTKNEFELLYNQLQQNFNCQTTTSIGRVLDAVSILLGFANNKRGFKHEATKLLEKNSTLPYANYKLQITNNGLREIINTTYLFKYLVKNIKKDKRKLAATAQEYIARGFWEIIKLTTRRHLALTKKNTIFFAGGMANNKIISSYLEKKGVYTSQKIPRGDEGIAFGQIIYYLENY